MITDVLKTLNIHHIKDKVVRLDQSNEILEMLFNNGESKVYLVKDVERIGLPVIFVADYRPVGSQDVCRYCNQVQLHTDYAELIAEAIKEFEEFYAEPVEEVKKVTKKKGKKNE
jgi:hypothetical protein